jgi:hypothetical protein
MYSTASRRCRRCRATNLRLQQLLSELKMDDLASRYDAALRKSLDLTTQNGN